MLLPSLPVVCAAGGLHAAGGQHASIPPFTEMVLLFLFAVVFVLCVASTFLDEDGEDEQGRKAPRRARERSPPRPGQLKAGTD